MTTKQLELLRGCIGLALVLVSGCSNPPTGPREVDAGRRVTSDASVRACTPGRTQACYCPSGQQSGTQACSAGGVLDECDCTVQRPTPQDGPLCSQLAGAAGCQAQSYASTRVPVSLLFVIDRSRSMACNLPPVQSSAECETSAAPVDANAPTKWQVTTSALSDAIHQLPVDILAGLSFFSVDGACGVDSFPTVSLAALEAAQTTRVDEGLTGTQPAGQTPIVGATILAYAHLHQEAMAPGNRYVVLLTDGAESCNADSIGRLLDVEIPKAREANIRTFVIGVPGSEGARAFLSEIAYRGGTASSPNCAHDIAGDPGTGNCHFDMTSSVDLATELASALGAVENAAAKCEYAVPVGDFGDNVNVQYTPGDGTAPQCFARDDAACESGANGWQYARTPSGAVDTSRVILCGEACTRVRADAGARVDILVGCAPII